MLIINIRVDYQHILHFKKNQLLMLIINIICRLSTQNVDYQHTMHIGKASVCIDTHSVSAVENMYIKYIKYAGLCK